MRGFSVFATMTLIKPPPKNSRVSSAQNRFGFGHIISPKTSRDLKSMKIFFKDENKNKNLPAQLRRAGYRLERENGGELAFCRSLSGNSFPRFHLYAQKVESGWNLNLHLDQKRPSYGGTAAHAGEYEGEVVETETARIKKFLG